MQERKKFKWSKSHVTPQKERFLAKALHAQKFFSMYEIFGVNKCCVVSTNLKMNCPDQHIFLTKQASKCCHCLTCT